MLENLKKEMEKREIKNKDIADLLGIKSPAVSKRIYGTVKLNEDEKKKIADFLKIKDYEYLFKETGYTAPKKKKAETIFSKRFSELLERDERTQKQIAEALGVNERTIIDWKQGKQTTNIEMLKKISIELNASIAYLSGDRDYYYPSSVNYLDNSMNEYRKQKEHLVNAVKTYLKYSGYKVETLDKIISERPIFDTWSHFDKFYHKHIEEYTKLNQLEDEYDRYVESFYKKFGITKDYDEERKPTAEEIEASEQLDKDEYYNSLIDKIDNLNSIINDKSREFWNKKESQANKVDKFFDNLSTLILKEFNSQLSDIIKEYNLFNDKGRRLEECKLSISSLEKDLFECSTFKNDLLKMSDIELINSKNKLTGMLKHRFSSSLSQYKGSLADKDSLLAYLDSKIKKINESISKWKDCIKEIENENH